MKRSKHNLSNYKLATMDMGKLYPVGISEVLPGDSFQQQTSCLLRVSPLNAPVMHPVEVRLHHFYVPNRLLWSSWEDFITGGSDGNDASVPPTVAHTATPANEPLLDYLGVPPVASLSGISALPVRAVNMIVNQYYLDQDLQTQRSEDDMTLPSICWEKDQFTAARPWTQKGDAVSIPLSGNVPIKLDAAAGTYASVLDSGDVLRDLEPDGAGGHVKTENAAATGTQLEAVLADADAIDVNDFRTGFALQRYKEARAKYGSNYVDYLRYLGINPSDSRLQRAEYLGGGKQTISFSEVLTTATEAGSSTDAGELRGHGIAALRSNRYRRYFEEHGFVVTMMSCRPKAIYTNGLHRMFSRVDKEDYYQQELALIGQEEIYNKEVYANNDANDDLVFGYKNRYHDYTEIPSTVAGEFRTSLDHWHLARKLSSLPSLNSSFVTCEPSKRIHQDTSSNTIWAMVNHNIVARRMVQRNPKSRII